MNGLVVSQQLSSILGGYHCGDTLLLGRVSYIQNITLLDSSAKKRDSTVVGELGLASPRLPTQP